MIESFKLSSPDSDQTGETDEEIFQQYVRDFHLQPEDFGKKILDVGSGSAQFAKWAREHAVSENIYSLDINPKHFSEKTNALVADAEHLPFADGTFDLVISSYSIPQTFMDVALPVEEVREKVRRGLSEMLRVAREEVKFGRIGAGDHEVQKDFFALIKSVLQEFRDNGIAVTEMSTGYFSDGHEAWTISMKKTG